MKTIQISVILLVGLVLISAFRYLNTDPLDSIPAGYEAAIKKVIEDETPPTSGKIVSRFTNSMQTMKLPVVPGTVAMVLTVHTLA